MIDPDKAVRCTFRVRNTGTAEDVSGTQPEDVSDLVDADVFRVSATASDGWEVWLPRKVVGIDNDDRYDVEVSRPALRRAGRNHRHAQGQVGERPDRQGDRHLRQLRFRHQDPTWSEHGGHCGHVAVGLLVLGDRERSGLSKTCVLRAGAPDHVLADRESPHGEDRRGSAQAAVTLIRRGLTA